jgi:hypothetical protein
MKHLKTYRIFEATATGEKYLLNLSSSNSMLGAKTWIAGTSDRITDKVKASAERSWSLYAMLNRISPNSRLRRLSNKELAEEIDRIGVRPLRIREEYDDVCKELLPQFHKLFNKFKSELKIDKKIEFMSQLEEEGYTFCDNSDIIKIINFEDLEDEMSIISDIFEYCCLYPA